MSTLSLRVDVSNPNHHLWNNNGTWFVHYTVHGRDFTKQRVRASLGTRSLATARALRDRLFSPAACAARSERDERDASPTCTRAPLSREIDLDRGAVDRYPQARDDNHASLADQDAQKHRPHVRRSCCPCVSAC